MIVDDIPCVEYVAGPVKLCGEDEASSFVAGDCAVACCVFGYDTGATERASLCCMSPECRCGCVCGEC